MLVRVLIIWCATSVVLSPLVGSVLAANRTAKVPASQQRGLRPVA